jgi:hypothetical protein
MNNMIKLKYAWLLLAPIIVLACGNEPKEDINAKELLEEAEKKDAAELANPSMEYVGKDSVAPISRTQLKGLTGFEKDSLEMRILFQEKVNAMNTDYRTSRFLSYANYILPAILKKQGGAKKLQEKMTTDALQNPLNFVFVKSGPVKDLGEVVDEKGHSSGWYCLMPHHRAINNNGQQMEARGYFIGYSPNKKDCYFVDITSKTDEQVNYLMPDLQYVIPKLPRR